MRVTVCELPHEPKALAAAWDGLAGHTARHQPEMVLLPECAFVETLWESERFDPARWADAVALSEAWLRRLPELGTDLVVGTRPVTIEGRSYNQGYLWRRNTGVQPLRRKFFLPNEPGGWESRWFDRGDPEFAPFQAGYVTCALNICTEMWALETYAEYAEQGVQLIFSPRATWAATTAKWLALGVVAAARSGAYSLSSNRVDPSGSCGGVGWIISPDGTVLASTSGKTPYATAEVDLTATALARETHPRYVFREPAPIR